MYPVRLGVVALFVFLMGGVVVSAQPTGPAVEKHGYLGVQVGPAEKDGTGVLVREVIADSPAFKAGLKKDDRVSKVANEEVRDAARFLQLMASKKPGDKVALDILRDGKAQQLTVNLGEAPVREVIAPPGVPGFRRPAFLGVQTEFLTPEVKKRLNVEVEAGAVVTDVVPDSAADKAGLKRDDVITALNDRLVKEPMELHEAVANAGPGKEVTIQLARGKDKMTMKATLREAPLGLFPARGVEPYPPVGFGPVFDPARRIRELERKVEELEKRLREMEKK